MKRFFIALTLILSVIACSSPSSPESSSDTASSSGPSSGSESAFSQDEFESLQAAGEVVLIDVFADWCPTCAKQQEVLKRYREENPDKKFNTLIVDFDDDKQWVRHFKAPRQSTFVLYVGDEKKWFSVAETRYDVIAKQLDEAIAAADKG